MYITYRIWQHLTEITNQNDVTAILTTHYIEEARQANIVNININLL
jgi:ABC-type multidrug transport system ATPase subunit